LNYVVKNHINVYLFNKNKKQIFIPFST